MRSLRLIEAVMYRVPGFDLRLWGVGKLRMT